MRRLILIFLVALFVVTVKGLCPPGQLLCDDGEKCITSDSWCDEKEDCRDESDENYCIRKFFWSSNPNNCKDTHFLCKDGRCVPKSAECNGHSDCRDGSDEDYCEKSEEKTEAPKSSSEDHKTSLEKSKASSEESKPSSEESKPSSEEDKTSEESKISSEETKNSSEEYESGKKDAMYPLSLANNDNDEETPALRTTKSTPSTTTEFPRFYVENIPMTPVVNSYYDKKLNGYTTRTLRPYDFTSSIPYSTRAPTFNNRGQYFPPPVPNYPNNYPSPQPTQTNYRQPTNPPSRRTSSHYPYIRPQSTRYPPTGYRESSNYNSDPYRRNIPNGRVQQPVSNPSTYNNFHRDVIPPPNGLTQHVSPHVPRYTGHRKILPRFNFPRGFPTAGNDESVSRGVDWILSRREPYRGWGTDTPRAIIALSLANNSFYNNDDIKTYLNLQVGLKLLNPEGIRVTELSQFVLALLATCQDPSDFQGVDLGRTLLEKDRTNHPFTLLTACLAGQILDYGYLDKLLNNIYGEPNSEKKKDRLSLSLSALSCYLRSKPLEQTRLADVLQTATSKLLQQKLPDGSFGSIYSTAIAAQALMSLNNTQGWNPDSTFRFLRERQDINGSFGDFLATYYVIPALKGRSLLHLRNILCTPKTDELTPEEILAYPGEKQYLKYSLHFGYPISNAYSVLMHVPLGINFFDVMRVAEYQNKHFNFQYDVREEKTKIYSISDVPNDPERAQAWHLYVKRDGAPTIYRINNDVRNYTDVKPNDHFIFWYHYVGLYPQL